MAAHQPTRNQDFLMESSTAGILDDLNHGLLKSIILRYMFYDIVNDTS
jgi:hypothetical protein